MKSILTLLLLGLALFLNAQAPGIEWQNVIGGYNDDYLNCIQQTLDGGYILGGDSKSGANGDKTENRFGTDNDYWVVKIDSTGNIQWQKTLGGTSTESLEAILQTSDGGFLVGGYSLSPLSGNKTEGNIGSYDYWIVKLDGTGNIEWQNTIGGSASDKLHCIVQTNDTGYLLGGESESDVSGDKTENSRGSNDYWIVKINSFGSVEWQKTFGGDDYDGLFSIDKTTDNGYLLGGYSLSGISGDKIENNFGGTYDYWIVKIDSVGNILWQNDIGGNASDKLRKVLQTPDNGFLLGGTSSSGISGDKNETSHSDDYWIVKTDQYGNIIWQNTISGVSADIFHDMVQMSNGNFLVGGSSWSLSGIDKSESRIGMGSFSDYWIVMLDSLGNILWENTVGGDKNDGFNSLSATMDGGCIIGGSSLSNIYGDKAEANWNPSTNDWWVVKIGSDVIECEAPTDLYADNITATSAKFHWSIVPGTGGYKIYYRESGMGAWIKKQSITNFKTISGLLPNTSYDFKIKSFCYTEFSTFSETETFTTMPLKSGMASLDAQFSVYPNPTTGMITINLEKNTSTNNKLIIINTLGEKIIDVLITENNVNIDLSQYPSGLYFISLAVGQMEYSNTIIKI
ncbi:MAG: T9SS type A sorting domain-containing protein [Chitinophagales bacterium]